MTTAATPIRRSSEPGQVVVHRQVRRTGTTITVERTGPGSWIKSEPGWVTLCLNHGQLCMHDTRTLAESHVTEPDLWCSDCARIVEGKSARPAEKIR